MESDRSAAGDQRGGAFYDQTGVRDAYTAHRHSGLTSPNLVMEEPAFLSAIGSLEGARVLDLGCGDGSTASLLMAAGAASYLGVDGSEEMIRSASALQASPNVRFQRSGIEDLALEAATFDLVVSRMALHYVERFDEILVNVHRWLAPGGRFVFSVVHPVITSHDAGGDGPRTSWLVDDYFERGRRERPWFGSTVTWWHRTVEDYVQATVGHGFHLTTLSECEPSEALLADLPNELVRRRRVPLMLLIGAAQIPRSRISSS